MRNSQGEIMAKINKYLTDTGYIELFAEEIIEIFKKELIKQYGKNFFVVTIVEEASGSEPNDVHGFPACVPPNNAMFDIQKKLPLFTKSKDSKSVYCAGYYTIRFDKGWVKSFCPKLITLQRYDYRGPFKTDLEMKQVLSNVNK